MNQKIYFWFLRTAFLASMLLQVQAVALAKNSKPAYSNYLLDKDVREFPRIRNNHQDVFQLVSHGKPGYLLLDGQWRNAKDIASYLQKHHFLSPSINHINIYGCDFGKGNEGAKAVEYLSKTLNVTIAASNNITGKDGDWTLEVGVPHFALSANNYSYNLQDFDNDGVSNANDIDADNDGILNAVESPACFYTAAQAAAIINVTTELQQKSGYFISYNFDNDLSTQSAFNENQSIANKTLFQITPTLPIPLKSLYVEMGYWNISYDASSTFKLQAYNGTAWVDLSFPTSNTNSTSFTINNTIDTVTVFSKYRVQGVAGTCWAGGVRELTLNTTANYNPSLHPKSTCVADLDADNSPNYLDLDSDGDGCSDALEAGATNNNTTNYQFSGAVGTNGLVNSLETAPDNGILNYQGGNVSYAYTAIIKACKDSDSDGVYDVKDIDADNDGILNASEASNCFYTISEASTIINVTSDLIPYDQTNYLPKFSYDMNVNTHSAFTAYQNITNKTLWEISPAIPVPLAALNFDLGGSNISFNAASTFKLQGFNGSNWLDLSTPISNTNNTDFSIINAIDTTTPFSKYRVYGVAGTCWIADVNEFTLTPPTRYVPSLNPKQDCNNDVDTDGVVSYLDLDADGDGCSDALEAGATNNATPNFQFTGPVGTNGLVDSLETVVDNGITKYKLPFLRFAQTALFKGCTDFDGDGADTAKTCLVRCANGLCDTSYATLIPFPTHTTPDTVILKPTCGICTVNTCVSTAEVSATGATYTNCVAPPGYTVSSSGGCSIYTPSGTITDTVKTCITICNNGRCDTTIVLIAPPRTSLPPDSISVTFSCDTCAAVTCPTVDNTMDTTGGVTYTTCGTPSGYTMVGPDANGCYIVTPIPPNADTAQTCIVRCANGLCDTSYVTLMKPSQPLSILVTSFTGKPLQNRTNQLTWAVSNEKDMDKYAIERSADQKVWNNLGSIAALNKGNNPSFQMIDNNPESSSFYRLVLRDAAGAVTFYPKIVHVQRTDALFDDVKVYPNPAKSIINMDYNSVTNRAKVVLYVTDIAGRVIKTMEAEFHMGNNTLQIDISDLADGSYLIDYHNVDNGNTGKVKFVKNAQ
jgi:hypothetical protein